MPPNPLKVFYRHAPIRDLDKLAEVLELSRSQLERMARTADQSYRCSPQTKKDGTERITWDAHHKLKAVQHLIKERILAQVSYPLYLQGGIRDREHPRDYARNAGIHVGSTCVINEDISDFFPSTTAAQIRGIWLNVFRFSPEVADCLTSLTTRHGAMPQGAKTSNHLANLVFWRDEYEFVRHLAARGLTYSRLTDDITISSRHPVSRDLKSEIVSKIYSFITRNGYKPKYRKHAIFGRNKRMLVNGLVVNEHPALAREERSQVRSLVHKYVSSPSTAGGSAGPLARNHVAGKVGKVKRFHSRAGQLLAEKLRRIVQPHS